jgi:ribosomal protein S18 acetylase RimI-like enzyme
MSDRSRPAAPGISVGLRPERPADRPFLLGLYTAHRWEELRPVPWTDAQKRAFLAMQFDAQAKHYRATYDAARWDLITFRGRRAGRLYVCPIPGQLRIVDISVLPEFRRIGIGTYLLRDLIAEAEAEQLRLGVHVDQQNPALRWYERLGFTVVEVRTPYLYMERPAGFRG